MTSLTKKRNKKKSKRQAKTPESQFNEALERYQRFKKQNAKFEQEMHELIERVSPIIAPYEIEKYQQLYNLTRKLIPFFSKKSLAEYLREELFQWIHENLHALHNNPNSHKFDIDALEELFDQHSAQHINNHQEKQLKKLEKQGFSEEEIEQARELGERTKNARTPEEFESLLRDLLNEDDDIEEEEIDNLFESLFEEDAPFDDFDDTFRFEENPFQEQHADLDNIFKQSSINKLFRRIAKAIHPDLADDESQKAERHEQMSKLIEARDQKDIAYILHTYTTTFGKLPDTFPDKDYINLTTVLRHMTERVKQEKEEILEKIPYGFVFHEMFYHKKPQQEAEALKEHIKTAKRTAEFYAMLTQDLSSLAKLREFIQVKMEIYSEEHDDFLLDDSFDRY